MKAQRFGEDAWLVESDDPLTLAAALAGSGLQEVVPSEHVLLLRGSHEQVIAALHLAESRPPAAASSNSVTLQVTWDGPDLGDVAEACEMSRDELVHTIRTTELTVAFCGFSPGFGYLTGMPPRLHLPRRSRPRPRVPAGSVAIAAGYAAVYPSDSPGGWHLIGTCDAVLFDPHAEPPALLSPGTRVRFE